ncbi:homocysteine S-methyltransferase [Cognatiyoonia sediminum]|uniref:Homocysteine S-methyltransferase n=1 Tax=Cognatiyoonia sediminum TaxID=1508389 RepID=A0A1M5RI59_9RHOB|nr:homocysteine S-methyltransferase family protein [Cognatiyoonia sediminum]SHH25995.1 homocysteine S-methyltransferase [Cognatiyoonia sediminum]
MITLLDGGMGQELVRLAGKATGMWSNQALFDRPEHVRQVHDAYFAAGADVATTNTYAVLPDRFEAYDVLDRLDEMTVRACELAVAARDAHGSGIIAGSMGPMGFSYQPDKAPPAAEAAEGYARLAKVQADFVDAHLLETMASVDQAKGGLMGASVTGKPVWIGLTVNDEDGTQLRSGEPLADLAPVLAEYQPAVIFLNCSMPEAINQGLPELAKLGDTFGAYANGFTKITDDFDHIGATVDQLTARTDLTPDAYADHAQGWADTGAIYIGGCCEVTPAHIKELARRFKGN